MRVTPRVSAAAAAALGVLAAAAPPTALHDLRRYRNPARVRCDVPDRDYVTLKAPRSAAAVSFTAVLVRRPPPADGDPPRVPYVPVPGLAPATARRDFALTVPRFGNEPCALSEVALTVWDNGYYSFSFRAHQNSDGVTTVVEILPGASVPSRTPVILPGSSGPERITRHIKRNLFTVTARGLAAYAAPGDPAATPGHPVLFEVAPPPFWVQSGESPRKVFQGVNAQAAAFFQDADRVEVELSYR